MENIILSLLMLKNMTVYEIKTSIEKSMNTICSSSMGSIQAALKKLMEGRRIQTFEYEEKGVRKKEYRITEEGVKQFQQWIRTPMNWNKAKNMEEGKFFFLGMLEKEERKKQLAQLIDELKKEQITFKQMEYTISLTMDSIIETNVKRIEMEPFLAKELLLVSKSGSLQGTITDVCAYQYYMLQYALKKLETDIRFFSSIYEKENNKDENNKEDTICLQ